MKKLIAFVILSLVLVRCFGGEKEVTFEIESKGKPIENALILTCSYGNDHEINGCKSTDQKGNATVNLINKGKTNIDVIVPGYKYKFIKNKKIKKGTYKISLTTCDSIYTLPVMNNRSYPKPNIKIFDDSEEFEISSSAGCVGKKRSFHANSDQVTLGIKKKDNEKMIKVENNKSFYIKKGDKVVKVKYVNIFKGEVPLLIYKGNKK